MRTNISKFLKKTFYSNPPLIEHIFSNEKVTFKVLTRGMVSLEKDNLVVFYCVGASDIWADKSLRYRSDLIRWELTLDGIL